MVEVVMLYVTKKARATALATRGRESVDTVYEWRDEDCKSKAKGGGRKEGGGLEEEGLVEGTVQA